MRPLWPLLLLACVSRPNEGPIVVGVVAPLTGPEAPYGTAIKQGVELALGEASALRRTIRAIHVDDLGSADEARAAAERLIREERAAILIAGATSGEALAAAEVAERAAVPMITPAATHAAVTKVGAHVFRACFDDAAQSAAIARILKGRLRVRSLAVLRDPSNEYATALSALVIAALEGVEIREEAYEPGAREHGALWPKLGRVDAIFVPGYAQDLAHLARSARAAKIEAPFVSGDGLGAGDLVKEPALEGALFTTHFDPRGAEDFVRRYRERFNEVPDAIAALGYDAARLALHALEVAPSTDGPTLAAAIAAARIDGVSGRLWMSADGDPDKAVRVARIHEGAVEILE